MPAFWMANNVAFEKTIHFWTSPNEGSPDVLVNDKLPYMRPPRPNINMSGYHARSGQVMIGLKTFGCLSGIRHCKEYIQVKLLEPLVQGEKYLAECWLSTQHNGIKTSHFGIAFTTQRMKTNSVEWLSSVHPFVFADSILAPSKGEWVKLGGTFIADSSYQYLLLGNFFPDSLVLADTNKATLNYAFYFVDDVLVRKESATILSVFEGQPVVVGIPFALENIYFEVDKATLMPASLPQLDRLATWMKVNQKVKIQIQGHTDSTADYDYNLKLSENRAESVVTWLKTNGIASERLSHKGLGEISPVAGNNSEKGRQLNRRVEFIVIDNP